MVFDSVDHSRGDFSIQDRVNREVLKSVLAQPVWVGKPQALPKVEENRPSAPSVPAQTNPMMSQLRELIDMKKQGSKHFLQNPFMVPKIKINSKN